MSKNSLFRKGLAFAVIILLISITFASSINANNDTSTISNQNKQSQKLTEWELHGSRHIDIPQHYRYITEDGRIHTVTKSRVELMDEQTRYYEGVELPIIPTNTGYGNHSPIYLYRW